MTAYKFLRAGSLGPYTGFAWEPGRWVETDDVSVCERGVHACRVGDLPFWVNDELWELELGGDVVESGFKVVASRGRLARRVDDWTTATAQALGDSSAARARALADARPDDAMARAYAEDAERRAGQGKAYAATYIAAFAAEHAGGPEGRNAERAAQAEWFGVLLAG
ncbi:MAG TPA: hypothetical protein VHS03_11920 [Gaiellaceae bacterium]|jgi:hypothetical protein|nr:hypothetical protein [Gaiellaceae bacterium]